MEDVFILSAKRSAIGSFQGFLSSLSAVDLAIQVARASLVQSGLGVDLVDEVFMGHALPAGCGQAPTRQVALGAGLLDSTPCTGINKVCASGMKSVILAYQSISCGSADVILAGGMESMTNVPYYLPKARGGYRYGAGEVQDGILSDGLLDAYDCSPMGNCAEVIAKEMSLGREEQDAYAKLSYTRALEAQSSGVLQDEITDVRVPQRKGDALLFNEDEEPKKVRMDKIGQLRPAFDKSGTVTAANASSLNDGAAVLILASGSFVKKHNLKPLARILSCADAAKDPVHFTTAPAEAMPRALKKANVKAENVDYYEINEAFSVVALANQRLLSLPMDKLNVFGGAVALGHPIGCSGARILVTLLNVLCQKQGRLGLAGICNGGGGASAVLIEAL